MAEPPDRFETIAYVYGQPELAVLPSLFENQGIRVVPARISACFVGVGAMARRDD